MQKECPGRNPGHPGGARTPRGHTTQDTDRVSRILSWRSQKNRASQQGRTLTVRRAAHCVPSPIRTLTVGSGLSPDPAAERQLADLACVGHHRRSGIEAC